MQGSTNRKITVLSGLLTLIVLAAIVLPIASHQRRMQQMRAGGASVSSPTVGAGPARGASAEVAASDRDDDERLDNQHRARGDREGEHHDRRGRRHDRARD